MKACSFMSPSVAVTFFVLNGSKVVDPTGERVSILRLVLLGGDVLDIIPAHCRLEVTS